MKNDWIPAGATAVYRPGEDIELYDLKKNRLRNHEPVVLETIIGTENIATESGSREVSSSVRPAEAPVATSEVSRTSSKSSSVSIQSSASSRARSLSPLPARVPPPVVSSVDRPYQGVDPTQSTHGTTESPGKAELEWFALGDLSIKFSVLCSLSPERQRRLLDEAMQTRIECLRGIK